MFNNVLPADKTNTKNEATTERRSETSGDIKELLVIDVLHRVIITSQFHSLLPSEVQEESY